MRLLRVKLTQHLKNHRFLFSAARFWIDAIPSMCHQVLPLQALLNFRQSPRICSQNVGRIVQKKCAAEDIGFGCIQRIALARDFTGDAPERVYVGDVMHGQIG